MDYIIDKLSEKIRLERDSLIKFTYLRARVEYIYYFLLGYYWNENHDNLSLNDLKCFVDKLNRNLTLGSIVRNIKLFSNGKFLADEEKILYKYVKFRNSNFGHGYTFDE